MSGSSAERVKPVLRANSCPPPENGPTSDRFSPASIHRFSIRKLNRPSWGVAFTALTVSWSRAVSTPLMLCVISNCICITSCYLRNFATRFRYLLYVQWGCHSHPKQFCFPFSHLRRRGGEYWVTISRDLLFLARRSREQ